MFSAVCIGNKYFPKLSCPLTISMKRTNMFIKPELACSKVPEVTRNRSLQARIMSKRVFNPSKKLQVTELKTKFVINLVKKYCIEKLIGMNMVSKCFMIHC